MALNLMLDESRTGIVGRRMRVRALVAACSAVACIGMVAPAPGVARDLKPAWGTAYIDDNPFLDPSTRQLLPNTRVTPRGWLLDSSTDGYRLRMHVTAYDTGGRSVSTYYVDEWNGVKVNFDRALNVAPSVLGSVGYDFCRQIGESGTQQCLAQVRLNRPTPPAPPAPPAPPVVTTPTTPTPPPAPSTPPPADTTPSSTTPPVTTPAPGELDVVPAPAAEQPRVPRGCVPGGEPIRFRLSLKQSSRATRPKILRVVFFLKKRSKKVVVDRRAPYRATLPVHLRAGAKTRGYARIRFRIPGRRGAFTRTVSKSFTICR